MRWDFIDDYKGDRYVPFGNEYFDMNQLKMDEYFFVTTTKTSNITDVYLYTLNDECLECPYVFLDKSITNISKIGRKFRLAKNYKEYYPIDDINQVICDLDPDFQQFGIYNIQVENDTFCSVNIVKEPVNAYLTILTVFLIHLLAFVLIFGIHFMWNKQRNKKKADGNNCEEITIANKKDRVMSIDTFRGISVVIMIFVNYGGGGYDFLNHTTWNGFHLADLVFPWFMWIMGTCIPMSLISSFKKQIPTSRILWNVLKRSVKLFLLGVFLNSGSNLYSLRLFGVLQRFGLCYFIVTTIYIFSVNPRLISGTNLNNQCRILNYIKDIGYIWIAWLINLIILIIYTIVIFTVSAPDCPRGYFGPGGLHKNRTMEHCIGGATGYIDKLLLGNHIYQNPTIYTVYEAKPFDPEGIVGCLPTIIHVMLGVQAGVILLTYKNHYQRIYRWLIWSIILGIIAGSLCGFSKENGLIPINKNLWSLSFVCFTCSLAFLLFTICYILIDMKKWWSGKPLLFAGMNAILLYIGHEMSDNHFPSRWYWDSSQIPLDDNWRRIHFLALLSDLWASDFWLLVGYYLYKINYFFTI